MHGETPERFVYSIDAADHVDFVSPEWEDFAARNDAGHLTARAVTGRPLFDFIMDPTTAQIYQAAIQRVRGHGNSVTLPFRCDGPHCRRYMELHISLRQGDGVTFESRLLREEPRPVVALLDPSVAHGGDLLRMCSWCKQVAVEDAWVEVEEAVIRLGLFDGQRVPELSHGICPRCRGSLMEQVKKGT